MEHLEQAAWPTGSAGALGLDPDELAGERDGQSGRVEWVELRNLLRRSVSLGDGRWQGTRISAPQTGASRFPETGRRHRTARGARTACPDGPSRAHVGRAVVALAADPDRARWNR
jgi:hypothetical protein